MIGEHYQTARAVVKPNVAKRNDVRSIKRLAEADEYWAKVICQAQNTPIEEAAASEVQQSTDSVEVHRLPHLRFEDHKVTSNLRNS
jgi:LEA14-like dessication related protein